ncbi:XdhC family protein [Catalinimonas niigatensis]|uniref:XdhC family protein n=1 Tax=Catalinimonas niigatensis TaxID=1397264 RepID=UPI002666E73D|nr:XdhC/CoxI family protein [Catalinimonas niigatensis]WPP48607.1 XdhC/CoxI family protein [Catalinimonas niigatensis]
MKELSRIVEAYEQIADKQQKAALATVVKVEGSSYRRAGARMLMTDDGRWTGAISGGCLEGDALRKARQAILQNKPSVVTYDTMTDENASRLGVGLGCNGIIDVLIEPMDYLNAQMDLMRVFKDFLKDRKRAAIATIFNIEESMQYGIGQRLILDSQGHELSNIEIPLLKEQIHPDMISALEMGQSSHKIYTVEKGRVEVSIEILHPSIELIIFGGGYDAAPVVKLGDALGWQVTVTDDCIAHTGSKRFPGACQVLHAPRENVVDTLSITPYTYTVLMSHNYAYDIAVLPHLLASDVQYIGILGPKKRYLKMLDELSQKGMPVSEEDKQRIHSPVGLDIGAETPDEIALSIISEIQAVHQGRKGGVLKEKQGFIHERI